MYLIFGTVVLVLSYLFEALSSEVDQYLNQSSQRVPKPSQAELVRV